MYNKTHLASHLSWGRRSS